MTEKTYTTNPLKGKETLKRLKGALRNAPVIGTVADVVDIGKEVLTVDYAGAAVATGTALAGITPIGRIASKGAKVVSKKLKKKPVIKEDVPTVEAAGLTDKDIEIWREKNKTSPEFRKALKGRNEELMSLASGVKEGKVFSTTYRKRVDELRPIRKVTDVPKPSTVKEMVSALDSGKRKSPIVRLNYDIPDGEIITARLDIPAYTDYDTWIPTLRHANKTMYKAALRMKNVKFIQPEDREVRSALDVAVGPQRLEETFGLAKRKAEAKGNKSPFAVMTGEYVDGSDDELFNIAKKVFDDDGWTQVGYDPIKRGFFYDRATGQAILEADEVIQVGHLVLAKNAKKADPDVFSFNQGGLTTDEQTQQAFNQGGYGVAGKFTPDTGVSAAKEKGTFEGLGYKGEAKEAPAETKTFQESVDMSSGGDDDRSVSASVTLDRIKKNQLAQTSGPMSFAETSKNKIFSAIPSPTPMQFAPNLNLDKPMGFSETEEMASGRVNFNNVRNALNFDIAKKKSDKEFQYAYDNLFPDVVKSIIDKNYFIRDVVSDNKDLGTYKTVWSSNLNEKDNSLVVAQFIAEAIGGNVADIDPTSDKWAWCSAFVDHILSSVGAERVFIAGESYAPVRVKSYLNYGEQVKGGIKGGKTGDIVIINPDFDNTVDHAGFLIGPELYDIFNLKPEAGQFYMLGGNQGNAVNIMKRNVSVIEGVRRISGITEKDINQLKKDSPLFESFTEAIDARSQIMVRSGDSMSKIAQRLDIPLEDFIKLNKKLGAIENANEIKVGQTLYYNKGGLTMEQQMNLFEEGGMKDDGLDRDPVSGNEIPPGSLAKEVRDDIPAQLSDGEYVVPADVVQYFGVKFFEDIRAEAKRGLAEMEATGRIGGEPMAVDMTMIAFGKAKEEEEKKKKAQGGLMGYSNGGTPTVDDDYFKQQVIAKANPTAGFGQVGQSIFGNTPTGNVPMPGTILITKTFYHPDGRIQAVQGTMRGNPPVFVPNQGFDQFTKAPWSETAPAKKQATTKKQERDDSKDSQFISTETLANDPDFKGMGGVAIRDAKGNIISMTKQGYGAVLTSANRLGIPMQEYHNLPLLSKAKLVGQEIKSAFGGEVDQDYIDEVVEGAKNNPENISILERFLNFITGGKSKKTEDTSTTTTTTGGGNDNLTSNDREDGSNDESSVSSSIEKITQDSITGPSGATVREYDERQRTKSVPTGGPPSRSGKKSVRNEYEDDSGAAMINKGGLLQKPKPKTRKPRGKGLGNKK